MLKTLNFSLPELRTVVSPDQLELLMEIYEARNSRSLQKRVRDSKYESRYSADDVFSQYA